MAKTNGQLTKTLTGKYKPAAAAPSWAWGWGAFSLALVDRMKEDSTIALCLEYKKTPLYMAEFEFEGDGPDAQFAQRTLRRIWDTSLVVCLDCFDYGYAAAEALYDKEDDLLVFDRLKAIHPRDAQPWVRHGELDFIEVKNVDGRPVRLTGPNRRLTEDGKTVDAEDTPCKGFWIAHGQKYNPFYGRSDLVAAWFWWNLKNREDGLVETLFKWAYRHSLGCTVIRHPDAMVDGPNGPVHCQDLARELVNSVKSGGTIALNSNTGEDGKYQWLIEQWAKIEGNADGLIGIIEYADKQMQRGILIPDEVVTHEGSTGGYSRSQVAASAYYVGAEHSLNSVIEAFDDQIIRPLVRLNFGQANYKIKPKPLIPPDQSQQGQQPGQPGQGQPGMPGGTGGDMTSGGMDAGPPGQMPPGAPGAPGQPGGAPSGDMGDPSSWPKLSRGGESIRMAQSAWQPFKTKSGKPAWQNPQTGEKRYQDKMPGTTGGSGDTGGNRWNAPKQQAAPAQAPAGGGQASGQPQGSPAPAAGQPNQSQHWIGEFARNVRERGYASPEHLPKVYKAAQAALKKAKGGDPTEMLHAHLDKAFPDHRQQAAGPELSPEQHGRLAGMIDHYAKHPTHEAKVQQLPDGQWGLVVRDKKTGMVDNKASRMLGGGPAKQPQQGGQPAQQSATAAKPAAKQYPVSQPVLDAGPADDAARNMAEAKRVASQQARATSPKGRAAAPPAPKGSAPAWAKSLTQQLHQGKSLSEVYGKAKGQPDKGHVDDFRHGWVMRFVEKAFTRGHRTPEHIHLAHQLAEHITNTGQTGKKLVDEMNATLKHHFPVSDAARAEVAKRKQAAAEQAGSPFEGMGQQAAASNIKRVTGVRAGASAEKKGSLKFLDKTRDLTHRSTTKRYRAKELRNQRRKAARRLSAGPFKFASTQFNVPAEIAAKVKEFAARIPDSDLADGGREKQSHVTIRFGLLTTDPADVRRAVCNHQPFVIRFGTTAVFQNGKEDVLIVQVHSPELHDLHAAIGAVDHVDTHPIYTPHMTIAYLKPGEGTKYATDDFLNDACVICDTIAFSDVNGRLTTIALDKVTCPVCESEKVSYPRSDPSQKTCSHCRYTWTEGQPAVCFQMARWLPYEGPHGGRGWKNGDTGRIAYQHDKPGKGEEGHATHGEAMAHADPEKARGGFIPVVMRDKDTREYRHSSGKNLEGAAAQRLAKLGLPPAWWGVQLSADPNAELQAIGYDEKGKQQYIYSAAHWEKQDAQKFLRNKALVAKIPKLEKAIKKSLLGSGADHEAACALFLIRRSGFRVGSEVDRGTEHKALGATTLTAKNVKIDGYDVKFDFIGKHGVNIKQTIRDPELAKLLKPRVKRGGRLFDTDEHKLSDYLHRNLGKNFKTKDLRTLNALEVAQETIDRMPVPKNEKEFKKARLEVGKAVAEKLGNTPTVALSSYVDPAVFLPWKRKQQA